MASKRKTKKELPRYTFKEVKGVVHKKDNHTGLTHKFRKRDRSQKRNYRPQNGVTLEILKAAGYEVTIQHLRYFHMVNTGQEGHRQPLVIVADISFRHDDSYTLLPRGGFTHLIIKRGGEALNLTAKCHESDMFDRREGVKRALERLDLVVPGVVYEAEAPAS